MNESIKSNPSLLRLTNKLNTLRLRHTAVSAVRRFFDSQGYVEVETPLLLKTVAPEEHIAPMSCCGRFLATSPELEMKALVAAGLGRCYQITRSFRLGELGRRHNPEFTILEWYRSGNSLAPLLEDLEGLIRHTAAALGRESGFEWRGHTIDVSLPLKFTTVQDAFVRFAGWDPVADYDADRFDLDLVEKVEPHLGVGRPEALGLYPAPAASLAKLLPEDPRVAQRVELYIEGVELANGFVELNDANEQRERFNAARSAMAERGRTPPPMPEGYLALLADLPDTVGIALGVDRLVMMLADASALEDVRAFGSNDA